MSVHIRELREKTGLTQKAFSELYGIPVSTLRKWEQGEASPPPYVIELIAGSIPAFQHKLRRIKGLQDVTYYYDENKKTISDQQGNTIRIEYDPAQIKEQNLCLYLRDLFEGFYSIQSKFNRDCRYDMTEDILWTE